MGKLNLFRKGRGKEYRQTKRAIKKAIKETGGFSATEREGGGYDVTGRASLYGSAGQTGKSRRRLARSAAEAMTAGIDDKTAIAGADAGTRRFEGGTYDQKEVTKRKKTITPGVGDAGDTVNVKKRKVKKETGWGWAGEGTQKGITTERVEKLTGSSHEDVARQRQELISNLSAGEKVSMKSSAFKMKYSPFNQGFGSPLNWNERSPLNNLKKGDKLVPSTKGIYMKESSPLSQDDKESCKSPKVWHEGHCMTEVAYRKKVSEKEGIRTIETEQDLLKKGEEGTEERKKITAAEGCEKHRFEDCCNADGSRKNSSAKCKECQSCAVAKTKKELGETKNKTCVEQHGAGYVWDAEKKDCVKGEKGTEDIEATVRGKESETEVKITKEECNKKEGFEWRDGACKKSAVDADYDVTERGGGEKTRCKKPAAGCDEGKRWKQSECKCVPKISDERQAKLDEKEKQKNIKKDKKDKLKKIKKDKRDKKGCECLEWDCE